ncbi:NAD-dependent epimerase/dehydratase family protein [Hoeflea prorocentri]|uniref:NAD(P)-dependent oxidoreductase n=1 Tax=Hoeflea prorocentri TaxID=1922333 RepID=A0A9X3UDA6_9HYPH|nr:NAD(P)-dependent oxidoreductase [Hoeflea prorocentri]MCY6379307.1 NAD(P)-dependent oxidoreductase [Hoeflea prorocentri]MDA5397108.1 NAD(P)-dependent oxidoreductase [Hoeflea prorocentri]
MTKLLVTGGSGIVGRFVVEELSKKGYDVTIASRTPPDKSLFLKPPDHIAMTLDPKTRFQAIVNGFDQLVHAGFSHEPGLYRGGEGDNPSGFWRHNFLATLLLFQAAAHCGVKRAVFLSSRAAYGKQRRGARLFEQTECRPDTHYGAIKHACERHLSQLASGTGLCVASLRVTGVYGATAAGGTHKWSTLFSDYLEGKPVEPRCGTEVHGRDVASAIRLMLEAKDKQVRAGVFNVSDLLIDRHDLLKLVQAQTGSANTLPKPADRRGYNIMDTTKIAALGWKPGGEPLLRAEVSRLIEQAD